MSKTERMILLVRCVLQERYFSGNAIAKNLSIVAEHKIKPVEKNPTPATYGEILHEILFNESISGKFIFSSQYSSEDVNTMPIKRIETVIEMHFK